MTATLARMTETRLPECAGYLRDREWRCVTLAGHFAADGRPRYDAEAFSCAFLVMNGTDADGGAGVVAGVVARTRTGIILHCLDNPGSLAGLGPSLARSLDAKSARCVLGPADGTRFLEEVMNRTPYRSVDYTLMISEDAPAARPLPVLGADGGGDPVAFVRCDPSDADALLHLQEGYEREEVVPPGDPFDRKACRIVLARALARQEIFAARYRDGYVAKAGTNARGFEWDQLGGVYTAPNWRGRGIARALMAHVVRERRAKGRKLALFVKDQNGTARRVYEDTGFRAEGPFRISYF